MVSSASAPDAPPTASPATGPATVVAETVPPLLRTRGLRKVYAGGKGRRVALDGVDLELAAGERLAVVGRSGSGKSTLARLLALHERADAGELRIDGRDPWALPARELRRLRPALQLIHQDPSRAIDPRDTVLATLLEPLASRRGRGRARRRGEALAMLAELGLDPALAGRRVPELSGGQKRRLAIARALLAEPRVLILDEAFSSLDLSLRARIARQVDRLARRRRLALVAITHDLRAVAGLADRLMVLAAGEVVEQGAFDQLLARPRHAETRALLAAAEPSIRG